MLSGVELNHAASASEAKRIRSSLSTYETSPPTSRENAARNASAEGKAAGSWKEDLGGFISEGRGVPARAVRRWEARGNGILPGRRAPRAGTGARKDPAIRPSAPWPHARR